MGRCRAWASWHSLVQGSAPARKGRRRYRSYVRATCVRNRGVLREGGWWIRWYESRYRVTHGEDARLDEMVRARRGARRSVHAAVRLGLDRGIVERPYDVGSSLVAFDPRQDVVVAGRTDVSGDQGLLSVAKFSRSGRLRWQSTLPDVLTTDPRSLAVDGAGHLRGGGRGWGRRRHFRAVHGHQFYGSDGNEAWRWQPSGGEGLAAQVAVDDHDAVFVVGGYGIPDGEGGTIVSGVVAKLDGTTGTPHWRLDIRHVRACDRDHVRW